MNFEVGAKWINDFESMLNKDERVIRHLVIKRDEAITKDCPPPPEVHTLRANFMDEEVDMEQFDVDADDDGQDWDDESELGVVANDDTDNSIVYVDEDDGVRKEARTLEAEKIAR